MTLVIPVCSGNISGRLEIIFFCLFKVFIYIPIVENAIKPTKDKLYYFETVSYRKFANSVTILICPFISVEFFQKYQDLRKIYLTRNLSFISSFQLLFGTYFTLLDIYTVTLEMASSNAWKSSWKVFIVFVRF
jgi:hypothetical protein